MNTTPTPLDQKIIPLHQQSAALAMQHFHRLSELRETKIRNADIDAEQSQVEQWLNLFISQHAPALVQAYVQVSTVLAPLQRSLGAILGPIIASVLAEMMQQQSQSAEPANQ